MKTKNWLLTLAALTLGAIPLLPKLGRAIFGSDNSLDFDTYQPYLIKNAFRILADGTPQYEKLFSKLEKRGDKFVLKYTFDCPPDPKFKRIEDTKIKELIKEGLGAWQKYFIFEEGHIEGSLLVFCHSFNQKQPDKEVYFAANDKMKYAIFFTDGSVKWFKSNENLFSHSIAFCFGIGVVGLQPADAVLATNPDIAKQLEGDGFYNRCVEVALRFDLAPKTILTNAGDPTLDIGLGPHDEKLMGIILERLREKESAKKSGSNGTETSTTPDTNWQKRFEVSPRGKGVQPVTR